MTTNSKSDARGMSRNPVTVDNELQFDPDLSDGPVSRLRAIIFFAFAAVILALVFWGLNSH